MRAIVFDTETTDLIANTALPLDKMPNIIEFCGIKLELQDGVWEQVDILDYLVKPPLPITDEITKITNITNDMVAEKPPIGRMIDETQKFFEGVDMVVAHNLSYDTEIMHTEAKRVGLGFFAFPSQQVCTVEVAEPLFGRRINLNDLHEHLTGKRFEDAHRARNDVEATVTVFKELWNMGEI